MSLGQQYVVPCPATNLQALYSQRQRYLTIPRRLRPCLGRPPNDQDLYPTSHVSHVKERDQQYDHSYINIEHLQCHSKQLPFEGRGWRASKARMRMASGGRPMLGSEIRPYQEPGELARLALTAGVQNP